MKKYFIILLMALLPTLAFAQQAGGHITRPTKTATTTTKPPKKQTPPKKQSTNKPPQKQSGSTQGTTIAETRPIAPAKSKLSYTLDDYGNKVFNVKGVQFTMIKVDGGTFTMGATSEQTGYNGVTKDETAPHQVTLSSYYIGQTEVTQELWQAVMGSDAFEAYVGPNLPVHHVSWDDCQEFMKKLNSLTGENFKFPTEAQWEFAARGGNKSRGYKYSGSNNLNEVAWWEENCYAKDIKDKEHGLQLVATKIPNELGLYDMSGNVCEWCSDWKGNYSSGPQTNPLGPSNGSKRVYRGGSWFYGNGINFCKVSFRREAKPDERRIADYVGLRLAL